MTTLRAGEAAAAGLRVAVRDLRGVARRALFAPRAVRAERCSRHGGDGAAGALAPPRTVLRAADAAKHYPRRDSPSRNSDVHSSASRVIGYAFVGLNHRTDNHTASRISR